MNRLLFFALAAPLAGTALTIGFRAANPPVELQPSTPGIAQAGNVNVTGRIITGTLVATDPGASAQAVVGTASSATGSTFGGLFRANSPGGTGIRGVSTSTVSGNGGTFQCAGEIGSGVRGFATSLTGNNSGVYGKAVSPTGFGGYFHGRLAATGDTAIGHDYPTTRADIRGSSTTGENKKGVLRVINGIEVPGFGGRRQATYSEAFGTGSAMGITAIAKSTDGSSFGVEAHARGEQSTNYGVYATAFGGATNYAGYFGGLLYATSASAGVKSFLIDHPLDPENKFLEHSSIESDERMNVYRGVAVTNGTGYATITVPAWFSALNEDIQYQLTVIDTADRDSFTLTKVVQELTQDKFKIRTSTPSTKVNWVISGRRKDATSKAHPLRVEREKAAHERGLYLDPEAFGKDASFGMAQGSLDKERTQQPPAGIRSR